MAPPVVDRLQGKRYRAAGPVPFGYDLVVDDEGLKWYEPDQEALGKLREAIEFIRSGQHSLRVTSEWLEQQTGRKLSGQGLSRLSWSKEEKAQRKKVRYKGLTKEQKRLADLKVVQRNAEIRAKKANTRIQKLQEKVSNNLPDSVVEDQDDQVTSDATEGADVIFKPNPGPQTDFLASTEREVFYGGARGGGKTYSLLIAPLRFVGFSTSRALLLRRSMPELRDIIFQTQQIYPKVVPGAKFKGQENTWHFPNGARIEFGYCENLQDALRYQGQSYSWIGVDELPQYNTPDIWNFLRSSLRSADTRIPLHLRATGNPGNVGSKWVKELFIEPAMPNTRFAEKVEYSVAGKSFSTEITRKFIPASVWDNPYLTQDEGYVAMLASLPEVKRQQFLYGNWDAVDDGAFPDFSREDHVVEPFDIPSGWTKLRGADYGYSSPSAVLWGAVDYDGVLWIYRELYAQGMTGSDLGRRIIEEEWEDGTINRASLDSSTWAKRGTRGPSIAEDINAQGCRFTPSDRSPGSRVSGKVQIHKRLKVNEETGEPMIRIFDTCTQLIRQLTSLPVDKNNPEDVDTKAEDHAYDALRYMLDLRPINVMTAYDKIPKKRWVPSDARFGY